MEDKKEFKVTGLESADWCFERISEIEDKRAELTAYAEQKVAKAEQKVAKIEKWLEEELKPLNRQLEYFKGLLVEYYAEQRAVDPKFKLSTPGGAVTQRKTNVLKYDEAIMMDYLKTNHQDLVKTVEKFSKLEVKKVFKKDGDRVVDIETGEIVDWVQAEENTSYSFKLN